MKETIDLLGKILTNILTALYEPIAAGYKALNAAMIEEDIEGKFEVNYISIDEFWD